ncbi:DNA primase [Paraburkholderia caballeronis]|uniref:DNA primase n=1 Tax=Paraburkholderia caballeronis TaxID=416943 RepID=UPI001066F166|nr:DNA primase [Paraburkholderia caballeronis]TDV19364.1 DNA primase [Paraburkholderia caballeronis]TDV21964.1 DNA primase [Paraburkholderia caballeronis]TDV28867.1 DNA primase [Paraburkholderia caballeronis]
MIPHSFLQDLLNRVDIVDVVGRYVQLKKGGANFMGLCPFHNEKSPSFTVSPTKQFYHCFGCGAHGTAIGFLMEHAGLTFPEAVNELAQSVGLTVPQEPSPLRSGGAGGQAPAVSKSVATALSDVMQTACDFYRKQLRGAPNAIQYLKKRGLTGEIAARFGLGYAPDGWQNLESAFTDYRDDALVESGLVIVSEKQDAQGQARRYDRFRERIMFPIRNVKGQVIGFGGRVLDGGEPKYLNSPETPLFNKGSELYGLFEARLAIREQRYVLVVEGYMDVVALAQLGFQNAVATLGTACTPIHVQKLMRQTDTVIFSFDGDAAGRRAARRALDACLPHAADNRTIRFLFLPTEHDPDSYVREFGSEAFSQQVERAMPLSQFMLNEVLAGKELDQPEGRARALFDAKPLLQALPANALRAQIMHMFADRLDVPFDEVAALCEVDARIAAAARSAPARKDRHLVTGIERKALRNLVMHPRIAAQLDEEAEQALITLTRHGELFEEVTTHARALGDSAEFQLLSDLLRNGANAPTFEEIFREILDYDENVRDLLMKNPEDGAVIEERREQERLVSEELTAAILKMRYDACCERLDVLSRQSRHTPEELAELMALNQTRADMKRQLGL